MRRGGMPAGLFVAMALLTIGAGPADAQGVALASGVSDQIAVAGSHVLTKGGSALLRSFSVTGGPAGPAPAGLVPPPPGSGFVSDFDASESGLALLYTRETRTGADTDTVAYGGLLGEPLRAFTSGVPQSRPGAAQSVHVSGQATLLERIGRNRGSDFSVHVPGLPPIALPTFQNEVTDSAIAGDLVAFVLQSGQGDLSETSRRLLVYNWRTRRTVYDRRVPWGIMDLDLAPDGRVVASIDYRGQNLAVVSPSGRPHVLTRQVRFSLDDPHFSGGGTVVALSSMNGGVIAERVVSVSLGSGHIRALGPRTEDVEALDADAATAVWTANGCALATPTTGPAMRSIPPGPCLRQELALHSPTTRLRHRTVLADVFCLSSPDGPCRGTVRLHRQSSAVIASRRYVVAAGHRRRVALRLSGREARRLRRGGSTDLYTSTTARDAQGRSARVVGSVRVRFPRP